MTYEAIPIKDYYLIVSDEKPKHGDFFYINGSVKIYHDMLSCNGSGKIIAQSKPVHEGMA